MLSSLTTHTAKPVRTKKRENDPQGVLLPGSYTPGRGSVRAGPSRTSDRDGTVTPDSSDRQTRTEYTRKEKRGRPIRGTRVGVGARGDGGGGTLSDYGPHPSHDRRNPQWGATSGGTAQELTLPRKVKGGCRRSRRHDLVPRCRVTGTPRNTRTPTVPRPRTRKRTNHTDWPCAGWGPRMTSIQKERYKGVTRETDVSSARPRQPPPTSLDNDGVVCEPVPRTWPDAPLQGGRRRVPTRHLGMRTSLRFETGCPLVSFERPVRGRGARTGTSARHTSVHPVAQRR